MASSLAEKIDQNFLHCGICLEPFRTPRALPCLHSFCEECLERWAKANKKENSRVLICPNCKKPTQIPAEGIKGFPAHFLVNSLQETVNMEKEKEDYQSIKMCSKCNKQDQQAKVYCQDCKHFLCETCFDVHKTWEVMKHHRIVTVEDLASGKVSLSDMEDQYCTEHDGEHKKFYCETCGKPVCRDCIVLKQCCRDHDTVPLKQASDKQVTQLKAAMKKCNEKKQECQDALEKTKRVEEDLSRSADKIRGILDIAKTAYHQEIDDKFHKGKNDIDKLQEERKKRLSKNKDNLQTNLSQIKCASELGKTLTETGSPYDIASKHRSVLNALQVVNQIQVDEVEVKLANLTIPKLSCVLGGQWKQTSQFKVTSQYDLTGIAVTSDGKVAVCTGFHGLKVSSKSGNIHVNHSFPGVDCSDNWLGGSGDLSITPNNAFVIPKINNCCQLFNSQYKLLSEFETFDAEDESCEAVAVAVDKNGCIILGMHRSSFDNSAIKNDAILIHNPDGSVKSSFEIPYKPQSVAVTSQEEIVVAGNNRTLQLYDYTGKPIQILDPPPEVNTWIPWYVCCSKTDELFVVNKGDPKAIYKYASGTVYMGCVTTEVNNPWGIALSHDDQKLFVTEHSDTMVKIFSRP